MEIRREREKKRPSHFWEISISVRNILSSVKSPADLGFSRTATSATPSTANAVAAGALPSLFLHISTKSTESLASDRSRQRSSNWSINQVCVLLDEYRRIESSRLLVQLCAPPLIRADIGAGSDRCASIHPNLIHPTAVIHPDATLGQGLTIGPFCTVGSFVKLGDFCKLYPGSHVLGDTQLGENCILMVGAVVGDEIPGRTSIGSNNIIGHHAVVGIKCQDLKYKAGDDCFLDIGDSNEIREYSSIHRSSKPEDNTVIGNNNLIMGTCHIAHDCKIGDNNILANGTLLAGHVVVEDHVHTAGATVVHQHCHLGSFSFIGGGSVISQDVPRFMMVSGERAELRGLNSEGLKRRGYSVKEIQSLRAAYRKIFMAAKADSGGIEARIAELEKNDELAQVPVVRSMMQSIRDSFMDNRRGICKF
ncbi:putative acyl-[acyl-carrier-protein]--UDP-N-acetylglucosamine O-acyltransferase, mitochondrial [Drosera capensis]